MKMTKAERAHYDAQAREETEQLVRQYVFGRRQPVPSTSVEGAEANTTLWTSMPHRL